MRNITFQSCLFWFIAYRRQNVTFNSVLVLVYAYKAKSIEMHLLREYYAFAQPLFCFKAYGTRRLRSITFKARLFWFLAYRMRNITVEAFLWFLFCFMAYIACMTRN